MRRSQGFARFVSALFGALAGAAVLTVSTVPYNDICNFCPWWWCLGC